jgi:hypothetical protein
VDGVGSGTLTGSTCIGDGSHPAGTGTNVGVGAGAGPSARGTGGAWKRKFEGPES